MRATVLESVLTCPECGLAKLELESMPTDACQYFYECQNCKVALKPKTGDCCVFCSYDSVKYPPFQQHRGYRGGLLTARDDYSSSSFVSS